MSVSEQTNQGPSQLLIGGIALAFLAGALAAWDSRPVNDVHVWLPSVAAMVCAFAALAPGDWAVKARSRLAPWAMDVRVWFVMFAALWLYFAGWTLSEHISRMAPTESAATSEVDSGWPLLSKTDISDLADELREYQPERIGIIYDDSKEEPLAIDLAKAMHLANWTKPEMTGQEFEPRLGIEIFAGSEIIGVLEPLKKFCRTKLKTEPTILAPTAQQPWLGPKSLQIAIGHNDSD